MKKRIRKKTFVDRLAERFPNGRCGLAACGEVSIGQIGNWKKSGWIPSPRIQKIVTNARKIGLDVTHEECFPPLERVA